MWTKFKDKTGDAVAKVAARASFDGRFTIEYNIISFLK